MTAAVAVSHDYVDQVPADSPRDPIYRNGTYVAQTLSSDKSHDEAARPGANSTNLSEEFWQSRPGLSQIRQAAHSRMVSADALLAAVLARISAGVPHQLRLPPIVGSAAPLSLIVTLSGGSGTGKSSANSVAKELLPLDKDTVIDDVPIGSGEGLVEMLFKFVTEDDTRGKPIKVKRQVYRNAHVYIDEGSALVALAQRKDSLVLSTLRTIYSGGVLGQSNASLETHRRVEGNEHTYGIVIAIQDVVASALIEHEADGTPQRFLWMSATDPSVTIDPPKWPGPINALRFLQRPEPTGGLDSATVERVRAAGLGYAAIGESFPMEVDEVITNEVRAARLASVRGEGNLDPMEAHINLTRLKVAGCLAVLDERVGINPDDWRLAGMIINTSRAVLERTRRAIAQDEKRRDERTSARAARRQLVIVSALDERELLKDRVSQCARHIMNRVEAQPGTLVSDVRRSISNRLRDVFVESLAQAKARGWVEERIEPGTGRGANQKRALYPIEDKQ